jgi:hypothetical protein
MCKNVIRFVLVASIHHLGGSAEVGFKWSLGQGSFAFTTCRYTL